MRNYIVMAHDFCENHRTFDRFSSRAMSLQRLGYERRDVNRLLLHTKEEWRFQNVPTGYQEQRWPYPCEAQCDQCQEAYHARRKARFSQTAQAFADLYAPRGWLEFQSLTVPPFAPKPEHIRDVLHDTPETEQVYQGWLSEYLSERVQAARDSLQRCIEHWREVGRRVCVNPETEIGIREDGSIETESTEMVFREYTDVPVRFPKAALRCIPEDLLSRKEIQRVYAMVTNDVKSEVKDEIALERGYPSVSALFKAAPPESHDRLRSLLSEIALQVLRQLKASGEFSERIKEWFRRADLIFEARLLSNLGIFGFNRESVDSLSAGAKSVPLDLTACSEHLVNEIKDAWLLRCWQEGWLQACVANRRVYIPTETERVTHVKGVYRIRQDYGTDIEPNVRAGAAGIVSLPEDCPTFRMPRAVLTEMLALYRKRLRKAGVQFRYIQVHESGKSEEHEHVHCVVGFDVHRAAGPDASQRVAQKVTWHRNRTRYLMARAWHAVSGNIIWKAGRWSETVREPHKVGSYMGKYLMKKSEGGAGRQTWVSHNLGLRRYNQERRLVQLGLLSDRPPLASELEHGGFCFVKSFSDEEVESAGTNAWVGLTRVKEMQIPSQVIPSHVRVDAVAFSDTCPSLGTAAGIRCVHRSRGVVDVIPRCDAWWPLSTFLALVNEGLHSPIESARCLFRELSLSLNRTTQATADNRHDSAYSASYAAQQEFGTKAFEDLQKDYRELSAMLIESLQSPRGP